MAKKEIGRFTTRVNWSASALRDADGALPFLTAINKAHGWEKGWAPLDVPASPEHERAAIHAKKSVEIPLTAILWDDGSWSFELRGGV